jgi:tetratricopeptide (TPR) repeat protein
MSTEFARVFESGLKLLQQGQAQDALTRLEQAVDLAVDGQRAEVLAWCAVALDRLGRRADALARAGGAIEADPTHARARIIAGSLLIQLGEHEGAAQQFGRAAILSPHDPDAYVGWAEALSALGRHSQAARKAARAIQARLAIGDRVCEDEPFTALAHYHQAWREAGKLDDGPYLVARSALSVGNALLNLEQPDQAQEWFAAAIESLAAQRWADLLAFAHFRAGTADEQLKRYERATSQYEQAVAIAPEFIAAMIARFALLHRTGRYGDAWDALAGVRPIAGALRGTGYAGVQPAYLHYVGEGLFALGDLEEAEAVYREAINRAPEHPGLRADLVALYVERGENAVADASQWHLRALEACRIVESLLEAPEHAAEARRGLQLGALLVLIGEYERACKHLEALVTDARLPLAHANLGFIRMREANFKAAAKAFQTALALEPDNLVFRTLNAEALHRLDRFDEAESEYRAVLMHAPGNIEAHLGLGELLSTLAERRNDSALWDEAIHHLEEAVDLSYTMRMRAPWRQKGSSRLTPRQLANAHYAAGYARVQSSDARRDTPDLASAVKHFSAALREDCEHFKARRALAKVQERRAFFSARAVPEMLGRFIVVMSALALLIIVQVTFLTGNRTIDAAYSAMTLGLLAFLIAGFYLPQILKFQVAGVVLEKQVVEQPTLPPLQLDTMVVTKTTFVARLPRPADTLPSTGPPPKPDVERGIEALGIRPPE